MLRLKEYLKFDTFKALECCRRCLNFEFLHDLHHGNANDEKNYTIKFSILAIHGELWGDFNIIYWISEYLHCSIHVWNKNDGWTMVKIKQENTSTPLILYMGTKHFELAKIYLEITNIPIHIHNDEKKKTTNHNMNINSETKIYDKRTKIFSWNL